jgi:threonine dehydrogenase-like Zn-dependent dehydrogenase
MPQAGEVLLRVDMAGICGSDLHTWKGEVPRRLPMVLGHEGVGTIEALGPGLDRDSAGTPVRKGDRVYWAPLRPCHRCYYCTVPLDFSSCEARATYGEVGRVTWNSYADMVLLPDGMAFCRIPDDTPSLPVIAFGCAMPTILQAADRLGGIRRSDIVVIQGSGPVGLAATVVANLAGADCVIVIDRFPERLALARRLCATETILLQDDQSAADRIAQVHAHSSGRGADVVIEASGAISAFSEGLQMAARNGRYLLVGLWAGSEEVSIKPSTILNKNIRVIGSAYASPTHYFGAVRLIRHLHHRLPIADVVTRQFALADVMSAFDSVGRGEPGKAVLVPALG